MIVIFREGSELLFEAPQDIEEAWELAEFLTTTTGINHYVGRA